MLKVWSKRHRDLARTRNQVACRLHAVLCDLVPGGHPKEISAAQAARILEQASPSGAVALARAELAAEFLADLRHLDAQLRDTRKKLAAAVRASRTSLTQVFGVGPVIAGTIIGDVGNVARFPSRDHFAAYNGTAPVEVSSGNRKIHRLSLRGNRRINHAIHMAAITQLRHKHSEGRAYYDKKVTEGKTHKEALRSLKRKISDAIFARLQADARQAQRRRAREGNRGTALTPARPAHTPNASSSDQPLPDLTPPYGPAPPQARLHRRSRLQRKPGQPLDTNSKEDSIWRRPGRLVFHAHAAPNRMFCHGGHSPRAVKIPDPMPAVGPSLRPCATGGGSAGRSVPVRMQSRSWPSPLPSAGRIGCAFSCR